MLSVPIRALHRCASATMCESSFATFRTIYGEREEGSCSLQRRRDQRIQRLGSSCARSRGGSNERTVADRGLHGSGASRKGSALNFGRGDLPWRTCPFLGLRVVLLPGGPFASLRVGSGHTSHATLAWDRRQLEVCALSCRIMGGRLLRPGHHAPNVSRSCTGMNKRSSVLAAGVLGTLALGGRRPAAQPVDR